MKYSCFTDTTLDFFLPLHLFHASYFSASVRQPLSGELIGNSKAEPQLTLNFYFVSAST